ncbi:MAG: hypothetical protein IKJ38_04410 [Alistipes sp.]|nr:hypothetical protein [Alistipes sp.]
MKRLVILIMLVLCGFLATERVSAQYYSWGADPLSFRWKQMKTKQYRVIYPDTAANIASRMMYYLDAVKGDIDYGYRHPQMSIPFVVHPSNFLSNGLVMWMPRRVEFLSTPAEQSYSMPWAKQLIAHEYRHAVQYNNLNRGVVRALSYVLGQQSSTIGLLTMPLWMMEGDAVMTETEMSTFGRGLQPSFTMPYRAYGNVATEFRNIDKWFSGSFKDYIPSHYELGYLMSRHGYNRFGRIMGDDVAELTSRRPYMLVSTSWVLKRLYGVTQPKLFYDTFHTLYNHWQPLLEVEETTVPIPVAEPKSHTTYSHPQVDEDGSIIMLKEDLDRPSAFVCVDATTGTEEHIAYTGVLSSRPALSSTGRIWWTEYRQSTLYAEKVTSDLCYMDIDKQHPRRKRKIRNALYPTPTNNSDVAWVEYTPDGRYTIVTNNTPNTAERISLDYGREVHGMAWDDKSQSLYLLITDDDGMHIARAAGDSICRVTRPAYTTLSDLRAKDGILYFGSIASGRDEIHAFDIASGREYRLSTSRYGSFQPAPYTANKVVATTYDRRGYMPVMQDMADTSRVLYAIHPPKIMLPKSKPWGVVNLDTVRFTPQAEEEVRSTTPPKRFHRALHAFNIHSWAPASYDPYAITEESSIAFNLGATIMSQNILSTMEGFLTWGWNPNEGSVFKGTLRYYGLGLNLWVRGTYGGSQQIYNVATYDPELGELVYPDKPNYDRYYSISAGASLPLLMQRGYHTRELSVAASWNFSNGMVANVDKLIFEEGKVTNIATIGYTEGVHLLNFGISYQDAVRKAHRDFLPPWAVVLAANYAQNPTNDNFGHFLVGYAKVYTPGFAKHHSLSLAASFQTSIGGFQSDMVLSGLAFKSTRLLPRGYSSYDITNDHYVATSVNYQLPVWYPDGGWEGVIYFKRLRLNAGFDYASFRKPHLITENDMGSIIEKRRHIAAYGLDLGVDFNLFTMPSSATISATFSLYRKIELHPYKGGKYHFSFGLGLPF